MKPLSRILPLLLVYTGLTHGQVADVPRLAQVAQNGRYEKSTDLSALRSPLHAGHTVSDTVQLEWAARFSSNSASSIDMASDVVVDDNGNVYVTGKSEGSESGRDYLTIKYNPGGQELWRARYDGPAHADDVPTAIAVDVAGNVYVTGMSMGTVINSYYVPRSANDYATLKYNSSGQQLWVVRYSGSGNSTDAASAIAVDGLGNVYVTGESFQADSSASRYGDTDFATIKYSPDGAQLWVDLYNGPNNSTDAGSGIALDDSGNVYVVGGSSDFPNGGYYTDLVTLKYDANGLMQWAAMTPADSNAALKVAGIVTDSAGDVYIAVTMITSQSHYIMSAKYNSLGQREWLRYYNKPYGTSYVASSLAIDHAGKVIIAGVGGSINWFGAQGDFILTMEYSASGDLVWARRYDTRQGALFSAADLAVDGSNNVYVTGSSGAYSTAVPFMSDSIVTLKYDSNGIPLWDQRYTGATGSRSKASAIAVDRVGNVFVTGGNGPARKSDFITVKYQQSGNKEWDMRADGEGDSFDLLSAMALDQQGNVYLAGSSIGAGTSCDFVTVKFDPTGNQVWSRRYNSSDNRYDSPTAIVVDVLGDIVVTGSSSLRQNESAYTTIMYTPQGDQQWVATYNLPQNSSVDGPRSLAVDRSGYVYVGGSAGAVKYDRLGNQRWTYPDPVTAIAVDQWRNQYVATSTILGILKFDSSGVSAAFNSSGANDIAIDDSGYVYTTYQHYGYPFSAFVTQKIHPAGNVVWLDSVGGDQIRLDQYGNTFVKLWGSVYKIGRTGSREWAIGYDFDNALTPAFALDPFGNFYLSGQRFGLQQESILMKYSTLGIREWSIQCVGPLPSRRPNAICADGVGNVYVAGGRDERGFFGDIVLLKYAPLMVAVKEHEAETPLSYSLSQNYPNPFNPTTRIRFAVPRTGHVELRVYDVLGREVSTLANEEMMPGSYEATFDGTNLASGMYFYRLKAGDFTETQKLLLLK